MDEAYLDFAATEQVTFRLGQEYIPFGTFSSHLINDPLTLEIGEAVETVAQASFAQSGVLATAYVYAGDAPYDEEDRAEDAGVRLQYSLGDTGTGQFLVGVDYASNIADSDALEGFFLDNDLLLDDNHEGYAAVISYDTETWGVIAEQLGALDAFDVAVLDFNGEEAKPSAARAEAWVSMASWVPNSTLAIAFNQSDEAYALALPKSRLSLGFVQSMQKDTWSWGVEVFQDEDYEDTDTTIALEDPATGEKAWGVVAQVAASL